jgi:hypothetical protein
MLGNHGIAGRNGHTVTTLTAYFCLTVSIQQSAFSQDEKVASLEGF